MHRKVYTRAGRADAARPLRFVEIRGRSQKSLIEEATGGFEPPIAVLQMGVNGRAETREGVPRVQKNSRWDAERCRNWRSIAGLAVSLAVKMAAQTFYATGRIVPVAG